MDIRDNKVAIITARGGIKRIPRKNIKPFSGKPIIEYSITAALESGLFDEVMVSTEDEEIAEVAIKAGAKVPFFRSAENSIDFANGCLSKTASYPAWYMEMQTLDFNYRLTDFQAALGISQLQRADEGLVKRRKIASVYYETFKEKSFVKGQSGVVEGHAYHLYVVEVDDRLGLYNFLRENNIFVHC